MVADSSKALRNLFITVNLLLLIFLCLFIAANYILTYNGNLQWKPTLETYKFLLQIIK